MAKTVLYLWMAPGRGPLIALPKNCLLLFGYPSPSFTIAGCHSKNVILCREQGAKCLRSAFLSLSSHQSCSVLWRTLRAFRWMVGFNDINYTGLITAIVKEMWVLQSPGCSQWNIMVGGLHPMYHILPMYGTMCIFNLSRNTKSIFKIKA